MLSYDTRDPTYLILLPNVRILQAFSKSIFRFQTAKTIPKLFKITEESVIKMNNLKNTFFHFKLPGLSLFPSFDGSF